jgi:hypothetical protein
VCGGASTERDYFRGLKKETRNPAVRVEVLAKGVDPLTLVRYAAKVREKASYDEVWCVTDVDEFDVATAQREAADLGISLAVSNPCFEYWLLLHFVSCAAHLEDYRATERRLKQQVPTYDKTRLCFGDFAYGVAAAVGRAKDRCVTGDEHAVNPSTGVWRLVETMGVT